MTLGSVCEVINGGTPKTGVSEYWHGTHRWITPAEMGKRLSPYVDNTERKISELGLRNSSAQVLPPNSVILSSRAPIGHLVINTEPMATNQGCKGLIPSSQLHHKFLYYYLTSIVDLLNSLGTGATFKELSAGKLKEVAIPVPPLPEQQRIVGILDEAFEGIATAKANAEKNLQNARALFESHLQSAFTRRGNSWKTTTLGKEIDLLAGFAFKSAQYTNNDKDIRLLRGDNIIQGCLRWDDVRKWPANDTNTYDRYQLRKGDVVLAMDRPWVKAGLKHATISADDLPCLLVQRTARLRGGENLDNRFLMYLIGSVAFTRHILGVQTGIGVPHISGQQIRDFEFARPPIGEQRRIAESLEIVRSETQCLESLYQRKLAALEALKKSLLHQAFTGLLTEKSQKTVVIPFPKKVPNVTPKDLHAGVLAIAYQLHEKKRKQHLFGHVKAEKIAHLIEARLGIDLGRNPIKDAAGPNDYPHLKAVEHRAKMAGFFVFQGSKKTGYQFAKRQLFDALVEKTRAALGNQNRALDDLLELMAPMNTQQAEIFATVYAAWNNLLLDGLPVTDESIVLEARENWHADKLAIPREKFLIKSAFP